MKMSENDLLSPKKNNNKSRKRKLNADNSLCNGGEHKKKITVEKTQSVSVYKNESYLQYKKTNNFLKVIAKPELLPSTPTFLNKNNYMSNKIELSETFISNLITVKCFNTDVNDRFNPMTLKYKENFKEENQKIAKKFKYCKNDKEFKKQTKKKTLKSKINMKNTDFRNNEDIQISYADIYKVLTTKAFIFHLQHPCTFSFEGEIKIKMIFGVVEVLGFALGDSCNSDEADLYSPHYCTSLIVESKPHMEKKSLEEIKNSLFNLLAEEDLKKLLSKLKPSDSILLIEQITSNFGIVLNKYFEMPLFPKDFENLSNVSVTLEKLQSVFNFNLSKNSRVLKINHLWEEIPFKPCTVLCGGKGVGKSTLLRYYTNKLIGMNEKVLCLDFDPGQCEFTHPGCLSAVVIDKPLLGPNFTHVLKPEIMVYFGDIDVSQSPGKYLECVQYIIETCASNDKLSDMKWCVNTMGFCKGIGVKLMLSILKLLKPNTVVQIKSSDNKRNYPFYFTPTNVNSKNGFKLTENPHLFFDFFVFNSCAEWNRIPIQSGLKPKQLREILSLSYFSQMVSPPYYNFNAVQPYLITFSQMYLGIDVLISPNNILKAFNGSIVSLSCFKSTVEDILFSETDDDYFKIVFKPSTCISAALGLIRGIDKTEKKFYVITHLSAEEMEKINCLTLGRIGPPHSIFLKQEIEGQNVYVSTGSEDSIQKVKRKYRVPVTQLN